jgi:hypothetical protein
MQGNAEDHRLVLPNQCGERVAISSLGLREYVSGCGDGD